MKKIVSVQDISCFGQCSLTVALPILSAYGFETAILPSGILSTHTGGFTGFTYHDLTDEMPKIVDHWRQSNINYDAIYTGYIGDARQFELIKDMRNMLVNGGQLIVDPAMADHGKLYSALNEDIIQGMKSIVAISDLTLPNLTEACFLTDTPYKEDFSADEIDSLLVAIGNLGAKKVILTGVTDGSDKIGAAYYDSQTGEKQFYYATRQPKSYHGTGDVFSSVAIAAYMRNMPVSDILKEACEFVVKAIEYTMPYEDHVYGVRFEAVLADKMNK